MKHRISFILLITLVTLSLGSAQQQGLSSLEIIDISQQQIRMMNRLQNAPENIRNDIFVDSIYTPYAYLWEGYLGSESAFKAWLNETAFPELEVYNKKAKDINLAQLNAFFFQAVKKMVDLTGHQPNGKWFIFFGPKWTNLGGFGDGTMLIDLAHKSNDAMGNITAVFPHEINHQIYAATKPREDNAVLYRILDEGFACYVSSVFHDGSVSIAKELAYTEDEYAWCQAHEQEVMALLQKHFKSNDNQLSRQFAMRNFQFTEEMPAAIGYYIGYRIVEEYVKQKGPNSWKEIYSLDPGEVFKKSKILK